MADEYCRKLINMKKIINFNNIGKNKDINILTTGYTGTTLYNALILLGSESYPSFSPIWNTNEEVPRFSNPSNDIPYNVLQAIVTRTFRAKFEGSQANYNELISILTGYANDPKWDMSSLVMFPKSTTLAGGLHYQNPYFTIIWFFSNCLQMYKVARPYTDNDQKILIETFLYKATDWVRDYTEYHIGRILVANYLNWIDTDISAFTYSASFDTLASNNPKRFDADALQGSILGGNLNPDNRPVHGAEFLNDFALYTESVDWRIRVNSYRDSQFSFTQNIDRMKKTARKFVETWLVCNIPDDGMSLELIRNRDGVGRGYGYCLTTLGYCCKIAWDLWKQNNDDSLFRFSTLVGRGASVKTTPKNLLAVCDALAKMQFQEVNVVFDTVAVNGKFTDTTGLWAGTGQGILYLYDYYKQPWIKNFCMKNPRNTTNLLANGFLTGTGSIGSSRKEIWHTQEGITPYLLIY